MSDEEDGATALPASPPPEVEECPACQLASMVGSAKCSKHRVTPPTTPTKQPDCPACQLAAMMGGVTCSQHRKSPPTTPTTPPPADDDDAEAALLARKEEPDVVVFEEEEDSERTSRILMANACCEVELELAKSVLGTFDVAWVKANAAARTVLVRHHGPVAPLLEALNGANLGARLVDVTLDDDDDDDRKAAAAHHRFESSREQRIAVVALAATLLGALGRALSETQLKMASFALLTAVYGAGTLVWLRRVARRLAAGLFKPDLNALAASAATCAYVTRNVSEAAFVVAIFAVAEQLEGAAIGRVSTLLDVHSHALRTREKKKNFRFSRGDVFSIRAGERVPCDGVVKDGKVWIDEANVSGESVPKLKRSGDAVSGGTVAVDGFARAECTSSSQKESSDWDAVAAEAQTTRSPTVDFGNAVAGVFGPLALVTAVLLFAVPVFFLEGSPAVWLRNALVVAVAACPCSLALAAPVPTGAAIAQLAKKQVIVKSAAALDACRSASVVAWDKTGTLTAGRCQVVRDTWIGAHPETPGDRTATLKLAAAVETRSTHPIAAAVVARAVGHAAVDGVELSRDVRNFRLLDAGVCALVDGRCVTVCQASQEDLNDVVIEVDGAPLLALRLQDELRPSAKKAVSALSESHRCVVLTGDREKPAHAVVRRLSDDDDDDDTRETSLLSRAAKTTTKKSSGGQSRRRKLLQSPSKLLRFSPARRHRKKDTKRRGKYAKVVVDDDDDDPDEDATLAVFASLTPGAKAEWVRTAEGSVMFVGDGANDAAALRAATVGVAFCASAAAVDAADVVVLGDDLNVVTDLVALAKLVRRLALQNVALAVSIKVAVAVLLLVTPDLGIGLAVLADLFSLLVVIANGLRPLSSVRFQRRGGRSRRHHDDDRGDVEPWRKRDYAEVGIELC